MESQAQYKEIRQRQDAAPELLRAWNKVWLALLSRMELGKSIHSQRERLDNIAQETSAQSLRENVNNAAQGKIDQHEKSSGLEEELQAKRIERKQDIARNRFFLNACFLKIRLLPWKDIYFFRSIAC